jgi:hypothetical protein
MKQKIFFIVFGLLIIAGGFDEGCEEEEPKPDYITVICSAEGNILAKDNTTQELSCPVILSDNTVRVDFIKAGGERFNLFVPLGAGNCWFETGSVEFKLYREQPIEVSAYIEQVPGGYTQIRAQAVLTWDEVYPSKNFGDSYTWKPWITGYWLYN